jgi:hypothetical protein
MKKSKATEARRVATEIAAIKAALHKRGYRLRKQPKQPVWKIITLLSPPRTKASVMITWQQMQSALAGQ